MSSLCSMVIVGLTGGIATGKSTVSSLFREHGFPVIDADTIAKKVVRPGETAYRQLRAEFGSEYFDDENGGVLIRDKLGKLVFNNPEKRKRLNAITHPAIRWVMIKQFLWYLFTGSQYIIFDTPLLYEVGYDKILKTIIVVFCDKDKELERLKNRDNLSEEDAVSRINAQMSIEEKKMRATILLDNNGSIEDLKKQVDAIAIGLKSSWTPFIFRMAVTLVVGTISFALFRVFRLI